MKGKLQHDPLLLGGQRMIAGASGLASIDIVAIATVASDFAILGSLLFLAYQIIQQRTETRYQHTRALEEKRRESYERLMVLFSDTSKFLIGHPEIDKFVPPSIPQWKDEAERSAFIYLDMLHSLWEQVWIAHREGRLFEESWEIWRAWIKELSSSDSFLKHFDYNKEYYSRSYVTEIEDLISAKPKSSPSPATMKS